MAKTSATKKIQKKRKNGQKLKSGDELVSKKYQKQKTHDEKVEQNDVAQNVSPENKTRFFSQK